VKRFFIIGYAKFYIGWFCLLLMRGLDGFDFESKVVLVRADLNS